VASPIGISIFIISNLMAETLHSFSSMRLFPNHKIPPKVTKRSLKQILLALDHAHKAGVIHTGMFTTCP